LNHYASPEFWELFNELPEDVQHLARENFELLKGNPRHPSLHFKKAGGYWSVRVGSHYRALATEVEDGMLWGWIGSHSEYDHIIR
jgi:hypothetical protein